MCRTCKAENPKWSKGVRVPVKDLPLFFASQPSWNFEQKIYGHNVVITERARPTLTGRLGCHDIEGVVHRRQDHFLVREIFHCPGKKYNCSPRLACTGRRRHCYGLCKVTVYSANKEIAIVQFAGTHGTGALQRRVWPYNQYETAPDSPPRDMSKKESKMRTIFGSPSKDEGSWQRASRTKHQEDISAFKQPFKQAIGSSFTPKPDENMNLNDLNNYYQPRLGSIYAPPPIQCPTSMQLYPSPPGYDTDQVLLSPPSMSPEERLKHHHQQAPAPPPPQHQQPTAGQLMTSSCHQQVQPYNFYQPLSTAQSPQNFWSTTGLLMNQHLPMSPPQIKSEMDESYNTLTKKMKSPYQSDHGNDYIPTLSEMNCRVEEMDNSYVSYDMSTPEHQPFQKRRKIDINNSTTSLHSVGISHAGQQQPAPLNMNSTVSMNPDIWRPYLHPAEFGSDILPQVKVEPHLFSLDQAAQQQDNFISFMLKGDEPNNHFVRDSQKILANMSNGLQLTKL